MKTLIHYSIEDLPNGVAPQLKKWFTENYKEGTSMSVKQLIDRIGIQGHPYLSQGAYRDLFRLIYNYAEITPKKE